MAARDGRSTLDGRNSRDGRNALDGRNARDGRNFRDELFHPGGPSSAQLSSALMAVSERLAVLSKFDGSSAGTVLRVNDLTRPLSPQFEAFASHEEFYRQVILDQALSSTIKLTASDTKIELSTAGNKKFFELTMPKRAELDHAFSKRQLKFLKTHFVLRNDRFDEIQIQQTDILSFFGSILPLDDSRTPWTLALIRAVLRLGTNLVIPMKHQIDATRPNVFLPALAPVVQTPTHGSLPSGHALQAYLVATVLTGLRRPEVEALEEPNGEDKGKSPVQFVASSGGSEVDKLLFRLAAEISYNRTVAGLHYPIDNWVGATMGTTLGEYIVNTLGKTGNTSSMSLDVKTAKTVDGKTYLLDADFIPDAVRNSDFDTRRAVEIDREQAPVTLTDLWRLARIELQLPADVIKS